MVISEKKKTEKYYMQHNRELAEFLGWKRTDAFYLYYQQFGKTLFNPITGNEKAFHKDQLAFHRDWNWIHLANKHLHSEIQKIGYGVDSSMSDWYTFLQYAFLRGDMDKVYTSILDGIHWFYEKRKNRNR